MPSHRNNWTDPERSRAFQTFLEDARDRKLVAPGGRISGDPVDLRGLSFPTIGECEIHGILAPSAKLLSGQQTFDEVTFRRIDLTEAQMSFSVWRQCVFDEVTFERTILQGAKFFGCRFNKCSFLKSNLTNASFAVDAAGGETSFDNCIFRNAQFRGATCSNPVFQETDLLDCRLNGFEFDGAWFRSSRLSGKHHELTFRGVPRAGGRNRLEIDFSAAQICWLHANHGVDLTAARLSDDASCIIIKARNESIFKISNELRRRYGSQASCIAKMLEGIFTDKSISPLSIFQTTLFVSACMLSELDESLSREEVISIFLMIKRIADEMGVLHKPDR